MPLEERQHKIYHFPYVNMAMMLEKLLKENLMELHEMKLLEEENKVDDPKYCSYHHLLGHAIMNCFVRKDKMMKLHKKGQVDFNDEEAIINVISYMVTI